MEQELLDFSTDDALAGFRLQTLEVYNWGTFHKEVWRLELNSRNGLLTGDIGSGKSTLVDAVTTLLVPAHRVAYNKAAGADTRERSLRSYVQGSYKSERSDIGHSAKPVVLRDNNNFSVILGVFKNQGFVQEVTLAQVFWIKDNQGQPERFYLVADRPLSITGDFSDFGPDIGRLKKRLKKRSRVEIFDTFPKYGAAFRRRFGIENEQALDLFHQTVSMKSVGNLTDFVREHMLEAFDVVPRIEALVHHFDDLNRAHDAVVKAKDQIQRLTPLVTDCNQQRVLLDEKTGLRECREALTPFFAFHKRALLKKRIKNLTREQERLDHKIQTLETKLRDETGQRDRLKQDIADNGGDRLERIRSDMERLGLEKEKRRHQADRYARLIQDLPLKPVATPDDFYDNTQQIQDQQQTLGRKKADLQNQHTDTEVEFRALTTHHRELSLELESLSRRKSNIHVRQIQIRDALCAHLKIAEQELPFAGELIQVREDQRSWEGAAERLLHNFGLSLLVPGDHYRAVTTWVDVTHLKGRLVYYLVHPDVQRREAALHPASLADKLSIKPDSIFYSWLEHELASRFDYACCTDIHQFHREPMAVTQAGQIKSRGKRHEKDDRKDIQDRSNYILGWTNTAKIHTLKRRCREMEQDMQSLAVRMSDLDTGKKQVQEQLNDLIRIGEYRAFSDLDWQSVTLSLSRLDQEKRELEAASNLLKTLGIQLETLQATILATEQALVQTRDLRSKNEEKQHQASLDVQTCEADMQPARDMAADQRSAVFRRLEEMRRNLLDKHTLTIESCANREKQLRQIIQGKLDNLDSRIKTIESRIIKAMHSFRHDFPLETREVDDTLASGPEYQEMLTRLETDNLPRFEHRFKELLNENTIREVANFHSQLMRERETIRERIERINRSLSDIEYNPGRYIVLEDQFNPDVDIRDFQQQLRACTEGALTGSDADHYSEGKFLQVRALIERFRGRQGTSDIDKRWRQKVTDVRNWFVFAASERWQEDHTEYEHYTDSGGKSGGQKEKLAYTVLAASLAYQFGLEWGAVRSRTFRFVAIDEAFGRGSDESTRYSLELFKRLNLQLLIVTPLQKIHIIEPYVSAVGLVYSRDGRVSHLRNMGVEAYRNSRETKTP